MNTSPSHHPTLLWRITSTGDYADGISARLADGIGDIVSQVQIRFGGGVDALYLGSASPSPNVIPSYHR